MFNRVDLIQKIINKMNATHYLEIGVFNGFSFLNIKCNKKIGVDPIFKISKTKKIKSYFKNSTNIHNKYYEMTSNDFFVTQKKYLNLNPPEVVFIDGLHTFEQTLEDCYNSLNFLAKGGIIILHDCNPPTEASATPALSITEAKTTWEAKKSTGWTDEWCGDTWKVIPYLKKNNPELNITVLNTDCGLGIVSKNNVIEKNIYQISNNIQDYKTLDYSFLNNDRITVLNLKEITELHDVIDKHI